MRGGRLLYFSDFSCSFVVVFLFPIPFVFFVLYCIASFLSLLFSCIVLSVFLSIVYNNNNNNRRGRVSDAWCSPYSSVFMFNNSLKVQSLKQLLLLLKPKPGRAD